MAKMTPRTLSGFMELLPAPQQQMERIMDVLRRTYSLYGFTPLDTPVIEASEVLLAKGGGETEKQILLSLKGVRKPVILVINKVDTILKESITDCIKTYEKEMKFADGIIGVDTKTKDSGELENEEKEEGIWSDTSKPCIFSQKKMDLAVVNKITASIKMQAKPKEERSVTECMERLFNLKKFI